MVAKIIRVMSSVIVSNEVLKQACDGYLKIIKDDCLRQIAPKWRLVNGQEIDPPAITHEVKDTSIFSISALVYAEDAL